MLPPSDGDEDKDEPLDKERAEQAKKAKEEAAAARKLGQIN